MGGRPRRSQPALSARVLGRRKITLATPPNRAYGGRHCHDTSVAQRNRKHVRIYVGNLPYSTGSQELSELFSQYGHVAQANVIMDRESGRSKGFGFVDMPNSEEASAAIEELNSSRLSGRTLRVSQAHPRERD